MQTINREKVIRNINRLLEKATTKQLIVLYQVAYEIVKRV